ncbi:uncharacterized protein LOC106164376 [Lingula anatina]|uniref:Uncharacterized protein LOC106164376 n=1 Tax=Lingula anatina TaxID=7574 RepID=A0A1S3IIL6_LINAN|nr:uncharacterized protein LOC106164376 [Lingula anatina]|eukprot:XP_013397726.1 uncharacterized protein LOC106164376 [Lingula anatina]
MALVNLPDGVKVRPRRSMAHTPAGQQIEILQEILDSVLESPDAQVPVNLELEQQRTDGNMLPVENVDMGHDIGIVGFGHVKAQLVAGPEHQLIKVRVTSKKLRLFFAKTFVAYQGELVHSCVFMMADSSMIFFFYPAMLASSWESAEVWRSHMGSVQSLMQVITSFWRRLANLHGKGISPGPVELADIVINKSGENSVRFINMKKLTNFSASKASQDIEDCAKVMLQLLLPCHFTTWPLTRSDWKKCKENLPPQLVDTLCLAANGEKSAEHIWMLCGQAEKRLSEHGVQCTDANPTAVADDRCLAQPVLVSDNEEYPAIDTSTIAVADDRCLTPPVLVSGNQETPAKAESHSMTKQNIGADSSMSYDLNDQVDRVDREAISLNPQQSATDSLHDCFESTDWAALKSDNSIHDFTLVVTEYIKFCEEICIPSRTIKQYPNTKLWVDKNIKNLIKAKDQAYREKETDVAAYHKTKLDLKTAIKKAKKKMNSKIEQKFQSNSAKDLWDNIALVTQYKGSRRAVDTEDSTLPKKLNEFYSRFDRTNHTQVHTPTQGERVPPFTIQSWQVKCYFSALNTRKAPGPDSITSRLLKECAAQLSDVFADIQLVN